MSSIKVIAYNEVKKPKRKMKPKTRKKKYNVIDTDVDLNLDLDDLLNLFPTENKLKPKLPVISSPSSQNEKDSDWNKINSSNLLDLIIEENNIKVPDIIPSDNEDELIKRPTNNSLIKKYRNTIIVKKNPSIQKHKTYTDQRIRNNYNTTRVPNKIYTRYNKQRVLNRIETRYNTELVPKRIETRYNPRYTPQRVKPIYNDEIKPYNYNSGYIESSTLIKYRNHSRKSKYKSPPKKKQPNYITKPYIKQKKQKKRDFFISKNKTKLVHSSHKTKYTLSNTNISCYKRELQIGSQFSIEFMWSFLKENKFVKSNRLPKNIVFFIFTVCQSNFWKIKRV